MQVRYHQLMIAPITLGINYFLYTVSLGFDGSVNKIFRHIHDCLHHARCVLVIGLPFDSLLLCLLEKLTTHVMEQVVDHNQVPATCRIDET